MSKPKPTEKVITGRLFKVQAGAFKGIKNAENLHERMERAGIDAFVVQENGLYKVQAGAYSVKENAEKQLQRVTKLVGDGFIVEAGSSAPAPQPKPTPAPKPKPVSAWTGQVLRQGNRGDAVRQLQNMLAKKYFYPEKGAKNNGIDGIYGAKTANAVRRFQSVNGLAQDGIAGKATYNKLK